MIDMPISTATAITSGVVALMLQANPGLTPDQVKYRLMQSAVPALNEQGEPLYNVFQQGAGRIWPRGAIYDALPTGQAYAGMDIHADLAHGTGWVDANGDGMMTDKVEDVVKNTPIRFIYVLPNFHNPAGTTLPK